MAAQLWRKMYGNDSDYKLWFTRIIGNLSKSRQSLMLKRGILTEIPDIEGRDFYPDLGEVGKDVIEGEGTLGFEDSLSGMTA